LLRITGHVIEQLFVLIEIFAPELGKVNDEEQLIVTVPGVETTKLPFALITVLEKRMFPVLLLRVIAPPGPVVSVVPSNVSVFPAPAGSVMVRAWQAPAASVTV
jgi:hypothetical protein